jgi:hypothetical protein
MPFLSFGDELCQYVAAHVTSPALAYGTNLFSGRLTDSPDAQAAIWVGGGSPPPLTFDGSSATVMKVDEPSAQVMVRGALNGYTAAETMIHAIYQALQSLDQVTLAAGGIVVKGAWALQHPAYIGRDEVQRHLFCQNWRFLYENANR